MKLADRDIMEKTYYSEKKIGKGEEMFRGHSTRVLGSEVMLFMTAAVLESM